MIPAEIDDGEYLLRTELLGLHVASLLVLSVFDILVLRRRPDSVLRVGGAQFYPSCLHLVVQGGKGGTWPKGFPISGAYKDNDP